MHTKNTSIAKASVIVLIATIISKIVGFVESAIVAAYFGTSSEIDIYFLALSISWKTIFVVFSSLPVAGLTMYNYALKKGGISAGNKFITSLIVGVMPVATLLIFSFFALSSPIASLMGSQYSGNEILLLESYLKKLSVVAFFYSIIIVLEIVLTAKKIFIPSIITGVIQNGVLIVSVIVLAKNEGVEALVVGYIVSYILQFAFIYICARRFYKPERFSFKKDIDIKHLLQIVFPLALAEATSEINVLVDQYLASMQGEGSISALSYSDSLEAIVSSLFIQTVTSVLLAFFSELVVNKQLVEMMNEYKKVVKTLIIILVPISIVTVVSGDKVVALVYQRGSFDDSSVYITSLALMGYGIGFIFKAIMLVSKRPFLAIENTKTPMIIAAITVVINAIISIIMAQLWGVFGITFATSLSYIASSVIYFVCLKKEFVNVRFGDYISFSIKIVISTIVTLVLMFIFRSLLSDINVLLYLVIFSGICFWFYFLMLKILKVREFEAIIVSVMNRLHLLKEKR